MEEIFHHFLRILRQSELEGGQDLLLLLDILVAFLNDCETNVSHVAELVPCTMDILVTVFKLELCDMPHFTGKLNSLISIKLYPKTTRQRELYQELGVWVTLIEILGQRRFLARDGKRKFAFRISFHTRVRMSQLN